MRSVVIVGAGISIRTAPPSDLATTPSASVLKCKLVGNFTQQYAGGEWIPAVPYPIVRNWLFFKQHICAKCRSKYLRLEDYRHHYAMDHQLY